MRPPIPSASSRPITCRTMNASRSARPRSHSLLRAILFAPWLLAAWPNTQAARAGTPDGFEGAAFETPKGWVATPPASGSNWLAQRRGWADPQARGAAIIQVSRPIAASSGSFDAVFSRLAASIPELARERPMSHGQGSTVNGHQIAYEQRCCGMRNGVSIGAETVGISDGRNYRILMLVTLGLRGEAARQARMDFDALVRSFRPNPGDHAFTLDPPKGGGGLDGVYTHLSTGIRPNPFGGTDFFAESEVLLFDPSGLFSHAIPGDGEDIVAHCHAHPADCGTYRLTGGGLLSGGTTIEMREVQLRYGFLETSTKALVHEGEDLRIGDTLHHRVPPLPRDTRFDGSWRYFFASSGSNAFTSGSVSSERILTLTRDGRFQRTGWSGASSTSEAGGGRTGVTVGGKRPAQGGRYEVDGFQLILTTDDGQRETLSLFRPDRNSDGLLIINGQNYLRRDKP